MTWTSWSCTWRTWVGTPACAGISMMDTLASGTGAHSHTAGAPWLLWAWELWWLWSYLGLGSVVATTHMKSMVAAQPHVNWKSWSNREWPLVAICLMSGHAGCTFSGHWWLCLTSLGTTYKVQEHGENNNWKFQTNVSHGWPHGYIDVYGH